MGCIVVDKKLVVRKRGLGRSLGRGLGNIQSIAVIRKELGSLVRKELGSLVRKRFRKRLRSFDRGSDQDPPSELSHNIS